MLDGPESDPEAAHGAGGAHLFECDDLAGFDLDPYLRRLAAVHLAKWGAALVV